VGVHCPIVGLALEMAPARRVHDLLWLIPVGARNVAVAVKHLFAAECGLGIPGAVRGDLGRSRAPQPSSFEMLADLPAARAARFQVLPGVASDLRSAVRSRIHLVAKPLQPKASSYR